MDFTEFKRNIRRDLRRQRHWKITILTAFSLVIGNIRNSVMTMWHNIILQQVAHDQRVAALADTRQVFLRIRKGELDGIRPGVLPTPAAHFFRSKKLLLPPVIACLITPRPITELFHDRIL